MPPTQPETAPAFVLCFDPEDDSTGPGGLSWFWDKSAAHAAFDDACANTSLDAGTLRLLEVLVPVSVIRMGWSAIDRFIYVQVDRGQPGSTVCLRRRPAKSPATENQTLHQQLVQLRQNAAAWVDGLPVEGFSPWRGICGNLRLDGAGYHKLDGLIARWPDNSGASDFPVPHPVASPIKAYLNGPTAEKWNPEHEYARNRLALLDWLIEQTTAINN